jgi:hypothetical protein
MLWTHFTTYFAMSQGPEARQESNHLAAYFAIDNKQLSD